MSGKHKTNSTSVAEPKSVRTVLSERDAERQARAHEAEREKSVLAAKQEAFIAETNRLGIEAANILRERGVPMRRFLFTTGPAWGTDRCGPGGWLHMRLRADGTVLAKQDWHGSWTQITDLPSEYSHSDVASWLARLVEIATKFEGRWAYRLGGVERMWVVPITTSLAWTVRSDAVSPPTEES